MVNLMNEFQEKAISLHNREQLSQIQCKWAIFHRRTLNYRTNPGCFDDQAAVDMWRDTTSRCIGRWIANIQS